MRRTQRLDHRRIRQDPFPDIQATPGERHGAEVVGVAEQLGDQPGLADAGLARHHHDGGIAGRRPFQRRPEPRDLGVAADHDGTGDSPDHAADHPRSRIQGAHLASMRLRPYRTHREDEVSAPRSAP
jgi:hypothetical protein